MPYHKKEALQANLEAVRTLLALENTRRAPSESDRATLRRYNGFGGLKCVLLPAAEPADIDRWPRDERELFPLVRELREVVFREVPEGDATRLWNSIKSSVLTSFYTDERIVRAIAAGLGMSGLPLRRMLDPSAGMGVFSRALTGEQTEVVSFEKDLVTGRILRLLTADNPRQTVRTEGFEEIEAREAERFDLVASNIPFGNFVIYDRAYSKGKDAAKREATRAIHNYFFVKGLDCLREGGLLAFITSRGVADSPSNAPIREYLMEHSRLVSALRLPDGMFSENAGTEVGSDLLILQKETGKGVQNEWEQLFTQSVSIESDGESFSENALFAEGNHSVATAYRIGTDAYGKPAPIYTHTDGIEGIAQDLEARISADMAARFDRKIYQREMPEEAVIKEATPAPEGVPVLTLHRQAQSLFDHPTAFALTESVAADPSEALCASLNKFGTVELPYMTSLLPDMEESDILAALEGRIFFNPLEGAYEVADKFISGNVVEKAERIDAWLLDHPGHEAAKQSLAALRAAIPTPIPFADLDFNLGERWIPAKVYARFASELFGTDVGVSYLPDMDEYILSCDRKNQTIWHTYAVQGEFRKYDGLNLFKHTLHNTVPDITKSKEITDPKTGEKATIKVRDGRTIQMADTKIEEIRQAFSSWLGRTPDTFKQQLADRYNRLFNCFVRPDFDGSHQTFPGLDLKGLSFPDLYPSQKDAVWMLKSNGGGICDHEVGGGKTVIMCTAAYEMKRLVRGDSYKMIANHCCISIGTVCGHINSIYRKLAVNSKSEAVVKAIKERLV